MKKNCITILCFCIIVILAASILVPTWYSGVTFFDGLTDGYHKENTATNNSLKAETSGIQLFDVAFNPDLRTIFEGNDSIQFDNGETYPLVMTRATVIVPSESSLSSIQWVSIGLYILSIILLFIVLVRFIIFIININKGEVFEKKNIRLLKRLSYGLLALGVLKLAAGILDDIAFNTKSLTIEGYSMSTYWDFPYGSILLGLLALLMAQIWSRGLDLKEENDLTI